MCLIEQSQSYRRKELSRLFFLFWLFIEGENFEKSKIGPSELLLSEAQLALFCTVHNSRQTLQLTAPASRYDPLPHFLTSGSDNNPCSRSDARSQAASIRYCACIFWLKTSS